MTRQTLFAIAAAAAIPCHEPRCINGTIYEPGPHPYAWSSVRPCLKCALDRHLAARQHADSPVQIQRKEAT